MLNSGILNEKKLTLIKSVKPILFFWVLSRFQVTPLFRHFDLAHAASKTLYYDDK